mmetsp:Transcript_10506/g.935  ORF Transcript_10506/g.935 Transcript_10506/m.935 type:complete len:89 (+) Transcript_10506:185-451(+)
MGHHLINIINVFVNLKIIIGKLMIMIFILHIILYILVINLNVLSLNSHLLYWYYLFVFRNQDLLRLIFYYVCYIKTIVITTVPTVSLI